MTAHQDGASCLAPGVQGIEGHDVKVRGKLEEVLTAECVEVALRVGKTSLTDAMRAAKMKPAARAELLEELMADATVGGTKTEAKIARKRKPRKKLEVEDEPGA